MLQDSSYHIFTDLTYTVQLHLPEFHFMKAFLQILTIALILPFIFVIPTYASGSCQPIYGGGQTCTSGAISIEKDVVNPASNNDVHDLGINDPRFHPGDIVTFHITLRNTGTASIDSATLIDTLPNFVTFNQGPGQFDSNAKTLTFSTTNIAPNQSQIFTVTAKVVGGNQLPNNNLCVINQVKVTTSDNQTAQDSSQFCMTNNVAASPSPMSITPATGPEALSLISLFPTAIAGFMLRKYTKIKK